MRCTECNAEVSALREFCPECGTPTSQRLRDRKPGARNDERAPAEDEDKRNRRGILFIAAAFAFGLVVGGQGDWFDADFEDRRAERAPAVAQAQQLFEAYRDDAEEADDRFGGRDIIVTGEFVEIRNDDQGNPDLRLRTSDPEAPLGADLVARSHGQAARLEPGQVVTVSCDRVARTGEERWLRNCEIEAVVEVGAAAGAAEAPGETAAPGAAETPGSARPGETAAPGTAETPGSETPAD